MGAWQRLPTRAPSIFRGVGQRPGVREVFPSARKTAIFRNRISSAGIRGIGVGIGGTEADVYEQITNAIVSAIEEGAGKYEMPWHALPAPLNAMNRKPYRGVNVLML